MAAAIDILGWLGASCLLLAYAFVSTGAVVSQIWRYQGLNFGGCLFLTINSGYYNAIPSAALNVIWGVIGIIALGSIIYPNRSSRKLSG